MNTPFNGLSPIDRDVSITRILIGAFWGLWVAGIVAGIVLLAEVMQ
jgi:hypothetical protein